MSRPLAVVTGAARGIGAAIAIRLAQDGHDLVLIDLSQEACAATRNAVVAQNRRVIAVAADVSDEKQISDAFTRIAQELGAPFVLVNNAGILRDRTLMKMSLEEWTSVIDVNLRSVFLTCRAAMPLMREGGGGRIVNLSSTAALGAFGEANYSAAKAGVIGLTRTVALEGGPHGITVNAVAPGFVVTDMTRDVASRSNLELSDLVEMMRKETAVGRVGEPEDVANAVAFFADRRSSFVTGQVLFVAGTPRG